jgi:hypothetical protein
MLMGHKRQASDDDEFPDGGIMYPFKFMMMLIVLKLRAYQKHRQTTQQIKAHVRLHMQHNGNGFGFAASHCQRRVPDALQSELIARAESIYTVYNSALLSDAADEGVHALDAPQSLDSYYFNGFAADGSAFMFRIARRRNRWSEVC